MRKLLILAALVAASALAQMTPMVNPEFQFFDNNGLPLSSGFVYTYLAGTTTPATTYSNAAGSVTNTNPIRLDASGRCSIWLGGLTYKIIVQNSAGVTIYTQDSIPGGATSFRKVIFLDNSGFNTPGQWSVEFDASPGQNIWSVKDTSGNFPFYLDQANNLALFQYNTQVGTLANNRSLTVDGAQTVTGLATFQGSAQFNSVSNFASAANFNGGITTAVTSNSSFFVGDNGSFYNRAFQGTPACGGVHDGWTGIDTSGANIWVCISGAARWVHLN